MVGQAWIGRSGVNTVDGKPIAANHYDASALSFIYLLASNERFIFASASPASTLHFSIFPLLMPGTTIILEKRYVQRYALLQLLNDLFPGKYSLRVGP